MAFSWSALDFSNKDNAKTIDRNSYKKKVETKKVKTAEKLQDIKVKLGIYALKQFHVKRNAFKAEEKRSAKGPVYVSIST